MIHFSYFRSFLGTEFSQFMWSFIVKCGRNVSWDISQLPKRILISILAKFDVLPR